jgi:anti-anti-sigma factor
VHDDDSAFPIAQLGDDVYMFAARGELDGSTVWRLQDAVGAARTSGARRLIADFGAVTYLDAEALAVVAASATQLHRDGGRLVVVTDDPWLVRLLYAEGLNGVVQVERSLRAAVGGLAAEERV